MSIISEVKCARCDRNYSGVRSRCPYCGARRIGSGKFSGEGDNTKGKMIIGVLIMAVLVVAAGVLLFTVQPKEDEKEQGQVISSHESTKGPSELDNTPVSGTGPSYEPSDGPNADVSDSPLPSQSVKIKSIEITYQNVVKTDFTGYITEEVPLKVRIEPPGAEFSEEIVWTSSNTGVFDVVPTSTDKTTAKVIIIGAAKTSGGDLLNSATLTVSIGEYKAECTVRVDRS